IPGPTVRRAGHAALPVTVSSGAAVLLAGGEGPTDTSGNKAVAIKPMELLVGSAWTQVEVPATTPARDHVAAAVDLRTGAAVLAGGQSGPDSSGVAVYDTVSWFDPATGAIHDAAEPLRSGALTDAVAVPRANNATK